MTTIEKCQSIFGHKFEARYDRRMPPQWTQCRVTRTATTSKVKSHDEAAH